MNETFEEIQDEIDKERWEAQITRSAKWGPNAWYIHYIKGISSCDVSPFLHFAWTEQRAEKKARKVLRRLTRDDERHRATKTITL